MNLATNQFGVSHELAMQVTVTKTKSDWVKFYYMGQKDVKAFKFYSESIS